ncbi:MAG: heparan-alpha-glucosaminide N-acetyltransferase domain-containing protein [Bacteroidota bacterium]|nr:heparan-alpha-glucosaminide N-acetyltransferase domain-containing protein [Bacteroidota bacterium]MDP4216065.1 heparan-alpha-glucosaminide N-acetyltransferase domain-containing protein [Bacteroidota bacterium]MDP4246123.1 heparan-alpha-glucosaminide N-acetyltransferase domain-containing protein [Bacteroidota bacterium]MDP4252452.1 heparan-alpha-glucosaminide N-acetyltransferase domain-containing protein [Bacteroidota bacterium]
MDTSVLKNSMPVTAAGRPVTIKSKRVLSIDLLRGSVMIIMALDHVREYFHRDAFFYSPTDLTHTSVPLFFTRWITHFCAPAFVFLAGLSAHLYGSAKGGKSLSFFLLTRGIWLVFAELFIITLFWTFNPSYPVLNFQVIWAIGVSMIALSVLIRLNRRMILAIGIILVAGHNLLDTIHVTGKGVPAFLWAALHEDGDFTFGHFTLLLHYPVLPWIGIMAIGYVIGSLYVPGQDGNRRKKTLLYLGTGAIVLFILLRSLNGYGDSSSWTTQANTAFTLLSFINVTKYPPSLLYVLMTLGPVMIFLSLGEGSLNALKAKVSIFGRVPMFYYLLHIPLVHGLAIVGAMISGHRAADMILTNRVNRVPGLQGYGFSLPAVYMVWICVILILYPCCRWFDRYKRTNQSAKWWLSYV